MATNASIFIILAPAENEDVLTSQIVDDFEGIIKWSKKNNVEVHTVMYNYIADNQKNFKIILDEIKDNTRKFLFPPTDDDFLLRSLFCEFLKTGGSKKIFFYTDHGGHICKVERKGFKNEAEVLEKTNVQHERHDGAKPTHPTPTQCQSDHDDNNSSRRLAIAIKYITIHGNSKTQETLSIPTSKGRYIKYIDDELAKDIADGLPNDDILYLVFDCCHAEGIFNTWQVHGSNESREKKVVLFAAAPTEMMTGSGFTECFCKHARFGRKMYEIGKDIGDDMFKKSKEKFSTTKYSIENLCVTEF